MSLFLSNGFFFGSFCPFLEGDEMRYTKCDGSFSVSFFLFVPFSALSWLMFYEILEIDTK